MKANKIMACLVAAIAVFFTTACEDEVIPTEPISSNYVRSMKNLYSIMNGVNNGNSSTATITAGSDETHVNVKLYDSGMFKNADMPEFVDCIIDPTTNTITGTQTMLGYEAKLTVSYSSIYVYFKVELLDYILLITNDASQASSVEESLGDVYSGELNIKVASPALDLTFTDYKVTVLINEANQKAEITFDAIAQGTQNMPTSVVRQKVEADYIGSNGNYTVFNGKVQILQSGNIFGTITADSVSLNITFDDGTSTGTYNGAYTGSASADKGTLIPYVNDLSAGVTADYFVTTTFNDDNTITLDFPAIAFTGIIDIQAFQVTTSYTESNGEYILTEATHANLGEGSTINGKITDTDVRLTFSVTNTDVDNVRLEYAGPRSATENPSEEEEEVENTTDNNYYGALNAVGNNVDFLLGVTIADNKQSADIFIPALEVAGFSSKAQIVSVPITATETGYTITETDITFLMACKFSGTISGNTLNATFNFGDMTATFSGTLPTPYVGALTVSMGNNTIDCTVLVAVSADNSKAFITIPELNIMNQTISEQLVAATLTANDDGSYAISETSVTIILAGTMTGTLSTSNLALNFSLGIVTATFSGSPQ